MAGRVQACPDTWNIRELQVGNGIREQDCRLIVPGSTDVTDIIAATGQQTGWKCSEQPLVTAFKRHEGNLCLAFPDPGNLYNVGTARDIERDTGSDHDIVIFGSE